MESYRRTAYEEHHDLFSHGKNDKLPDHGDLEESVPLAAGVQHNTYYGDTITAMICISVLFVTLAYILLCMFYRRRIRLLTETGKGGWKLWKLKKQVTDLEDRKAAEIVKGIQKSAEFYSI